MTFPDEADLLSLRVFEHFIRLVRQLGTTAGLSFPATATLLRISDGGARRLTELAAVEGLSQPGMTQLVTRLERRHLVRRVPCPDDGRAVLVEATDEGRALVARWRAERSGALRRLVEKLDPADRATVRAALPALARLAALALDGDPADGVGHRHRATA